MSISLILLILGLFYFFAHALIFVFKKTRVPDVVMLVILGILFGPLLGFVSLEDFGKAGSVLTVIALAVILFESGTPLQLKSVAQSLFSTLALTLTTVFVTIAVIATGTLIFFGGDWHMALLTGAILCGTSSAVVIPMVQSLKLSERPGTILILESALTDVLCIILTFSFLGLKSEAGANITGVLQNIFTSFAFAGLIGILGGFFWLWVWNKVRQLPTSIFTTIAFVFVLYGLGELLGVSGAIVALCFGMTLANTPLFVKGREVPKISDEEKRFYQEIVFLLKTFFFVYLGISIHISDFGIITTSIILVSLLYFLRIWIARFTLTKNGCDSRDAKIAAVMIPKGLASAVLSSLLIQQGLEGAETIQAIVFSVIIYSIVLTAILVPLVDQGRLSGLYDRLMGRSSQES